MRTNFLRNQRFLARFHLLYRNLGELIVNTKSGIDMAAQINNHKSDTFLVIYFFIAIAILGVYIGMKVQEFPLLQVIGLFLFGFVSYTFTEYVIHRYLLHFDNLYKNPKWSHKGHHLFPNHKKNFDIHLPEAMVLVLIFGGFYWLFLGSWIYVFFAGYALGYAAYHFIHYTVHTSKPPKNFFKYLWYHHHVHHHIDENKAFGVSSPFWDFMFGTLPEFNKSDH